MTFESYGQFDQDTVPSFDSITVDDDRDLDSTFFIVMNRWGKSIALPRGETDSVWNYWNHIPGLKDDKLYLTLGNTGSPAQSAYWQPLRQVGFDPGIHHLDLYRVKSVETKFYATDRAYTQLHYNQTPQQTKSGTNIKFGRAFDTKSGISLQYDRINDLGEYQHQKTRQTSIDVGMYVFPAINKKIFFSYLSNNFTIEDNGGISNPEFFNDPTYDDRILMPVKIVNSLSELKEREARITASWNLTNHKDTTARGLSLLYDVYYNTFSYKYSDGNSDTAVYKQYAVHEDGQRAWVKNNRISNLLGISVDYGASQKSLFNGQLSASLEYGLNQYTQDFQSRDINNLILHGGFTQQLSGRVRLQALIDLGLGDQAGDYLLQGRLYFKPTENISVQGHLISQLRTPTGVLSTFNSLGQEIYSRNFGASKYNTIGGKIKYDFIGFSGEINNTIVTDHIYFNSQLEFENINTSFNVLQIKLALERQIGILYTQNSVSLQNSSDNRLPLPTYFSKHYLGTRLNLFKRNLQLDTGIDAVIMPDFDGYGYFPLTGQFFPEQAAIPYGYTANGIIGLRIDQFNVYIKLENMQTIWEDQPRYLVKDYPLYDFRLRIGFRWLLRG
jgi:hypothetical protein